MILYRFFYIRNKCKRNGRLKFKSKLEKNCFSEKTVSHLTLVSSGLLLLLVMSRILRNIYETSKAGFDKILRNIHAETPGQPARPDW